MSQGDANPKVSTSPVYILAGCMIDDAQREKLKIEIDQVKYKLYLLPFKKSYYANFI